MCIRDRYKQALKPIWTYGIQLWGCAKKSNINIIKTFQNKVPVSYTHLDVYKRQLSIQIKNQQKYTSILAIINNYNYNYFTKYIIFNIKKFLLFNNTLYFIFRLKDKVCKLTLSRSRYQYSNLWILVKCTLIFNIKQYCSCQLVSVAVSELSQPEDYNDNRLQSSCY